MRISRDRLRTLFRRYYENAATESEISELMAAIREGGEDEWLELVIREEWNALRPDARLFTDATSERILEVVLQNGKEESTGRPRVRPLHAYRYWVAVVLLMAGFGAYWKWKDNRNDGLTTKVTAAITPGTNKAALTLSDGSVVPLDSAGLTVGGSIDMHAIAGNENGRLVYKTSEELKEATETFNTLATPRGGQYQVVLPDGSKVWLNASSSIRYPLVFPGTERRVEIKGEVYFEVQPDRSRPFTVQFGDNEVTVLGTSFNVKYYADEAMQTTLIEGAVALRSAGNEQLLRPGEQASTSADGKIVLTKVDVEEKIAWKNGLFLFQAAGIPEIMKQVARWYDIEVTYEGNFPERQLTGKVSRNVSITELMAIFQYAGINHRVEGRKIVIEE